jgi:hypothetical protein
VGINGPGGDGGGGDAGPKVLAVRPQPGKLELADAASLSGDAVLSRLGSARRAVFGRGGGAASPGRTLGHPPQAAGIKYGLTAPAG